MTGGLELYRIVRKKNLNKDVKLMDIEAPHIAAKASPGQFIILRTNEEGERIPLTISDFDRDSGNITIIFQEVGKTTKELGMMKEGDELHDFVGPLGKATELEGYKKAAVIGGGLGTAIAYPQAKMLHSFGTSVDSITGFRNKDLIVLEKEMADVSERLFITTDDGSNGTKGFVSDVLKRLIDEGNNYEIVIAIGPLIMMKVVSELTRQYDIKTIVSMNPVMVDGTGMCGSCRVKVNNEIKFACVDGPEFDAHQVDWDEFLKRNSRYKKEEHECMHFKG